MCAAFALPMFHFISKHIIFAYIKTNQKNIFVILVRLRLESGAVRKLPRILFKPLANLPPFPLEISEPILRGR